MARRLTVEIERFPIAGSFVIARGAKTEAVVVTATMSENGFSGRGECVPYARYGESVESVVAAIEAARVAVEAGATREDLLRLMPAGAARNAVDCALWDLEAKAGGKSAATLAGIATPADLVTAYTLSLGEADAMATQAKANAERPLLKVKVGRPGDAARIRAVTSAAPKSRIILDANEGWAGAELEENLAVAAECGVLLVEQPLPAGEDKRLADIVRPLPVCADESVHGAGDLAALKDCYDAVNIKLDKTGGLTAALAMRDEARRLGFKVMVGCMVGTSLAMAPALLVAQGADFVDLDGPLLLARDREPGLSYRGSVVSPPRPELWG
jgi:L-alanine-DL-glutamate epimerase-like enolase superfamily enzyme